MCLFWMRPQRKRCTVKGGKAWRNLGKVFVMQPMISLISTLPVDKSTTDMFEHQQCIISYIEVSLSREWKTKLFFQTMMAVMRGPMASM